MVDVCIVTLSVIIILILVYVRLKIYNKECMWYWDNISHNYRTQCGGAIRFAGGSKKISFKYCPICEKPIAINPFIDRQEGSP